MNTIINWQVFSPIPFSEYNPLITKISEQQFMDINKRQGHFDTHDTEHLSFYVKDYITGKSAMMMLSFIIKLTFNVHQRLSMVYISARKKIENLIPIIKTDSDIRLFRSNLIDRDNFTSLALNTIYSLFVRFGDVHVIRAVEPALRLKYHDIDCRVYQTITDSAVSALYKSCLTKRNFNLGSRSQLSKLILEYQDDMRVNLTV